MYRSSVVGLLGFLLLASGNLVAQDQPDLVGTWRLENVSAGKDARCGETSVVGELNVTKKITARAYRGNVRLQRSGDRCGVMGYDENTFTLRIRDDVVSIEYDEEQGWTEESLLLRGDTMTGADEEGTELTYVRVVEPPAAKEPAVDMAELDEFLAGLAPDYTRALRAAFGAKMLQNLRDTGLSRDEAIEVATTTVQRMTECVLDQVRKNVVALGISVADLKRDQRRYGMLQPEKVEYRSIECVHDTATNAGVIIH